jgi:hypothetical protein
MLRTIRKLRRNREGMNKGVVFPMNLKKGPTVLHAWFMGKDNTTLSAFM